METEIRVKNGKVNVIEKSQKEMLIIHLEKIIKEIKNCPDEIDVSCLIIQQQKGKYVTDIHEYL